MSAILSVLNHFFSLDLNWLLQFALSNILWVFLFAAAAAFFYEKKNWFWSFVYITIYVWASIEFTNIVGWQLLSKDFLMITLIAAIAVLAFFQYDPWGSKNLLLVNTLRFLTVLIVFNLFLA